jgi:hypothetical protein
MESAVEARVERIESLVHAMADQENRMEISAARQSG